MGFIRFMGFAGSLLGVCKLSAWGDAPSCDIKGFQPYRSSPWSVAHRTPKAD